MVILLLPFTSCKSEETESISEVLKISTWVMDKKYEDTGHWESDVNYPADGYWVSNKDESAGHNVFKFEALALNDIRVMAPMGYMKTSNLNILFEFDGIIELEPDNPEDQLIQLGYNYDDPAEPILDFVTTTYEKVRMPAPINFNLCPLGVFTKETCIIQTDTLKDHEYYLNVKAYKHDGTLLITAKLKLVVLDDKFTDNEKRSRFLSIELVSYDYSDIYKFD